MKPQSVADIQGPWLEADFASSLIERCKRYWNVPVTQLPDEALATYVRQRIALKLTVPEAQRRVRGGLCDGSEMYDGELAEALRTVGSVWVT
jgi:hypothetical protein